MKVRRVDFYPDDWIAGTGILTLEERGVYITACALIYSRGGAIEGADLRRMCPGHGRSFKTALTRLIDLGKLVETEGKLDQNRCETELKRAQNRIETSRENAAKGGRPPSKISRLEKPDGFISSRARVTSGISQEHQTAKGDSEGGGELGRSAPSRRDASTTGEQRDAGERDALTPEERAERIARLDEVLAKIGGMPTTNGVHDPAAYKRAVTDAKRDAWLRELHGWATGRFDGNARVEAWEAISAAMEAGSRDATPKHIRKQIDELDKLYRAEQNQESTP